jgi:hypothetical protein
VGAYSLLPRLAYMKLRTDRPYQWDPAHREVASEHLRRMFLQSQGPTTHQAARFRSPTPERFE